MQPQSVAMILGSSRLGIRELNLMHMKRSCMGPGFSKLSSSSLAIITIGTFLLLVNILVYLASSVHSWPSIILRIMFAKAVPFSVSFMELVEDPQVIVVVCSCKVIPPGACKVDLECVSEHIED